MYAALKIIHILALILWLGPAIGAYWILLKMGDHVSSQQRLVMERAYEFVLRVEHFAFLIVIASGLGLLHVIGSVFLKVDWFLTKLYLIAGIVLIEIFDIYLSHFLFRRLIRKSGEPSSQAWKQFTKNRNIFYFISVPILLFLVIAILYLVIFKP